MGTAATEVPPRMAVVYDVPYGEADEEPLLLDYLRPEPMPETPIPAVVWIHGGGWEGATSGSIWRIGWGRFWCGTVFLP